MKGLLNNGLIYTNKILKNHAGFKILDFYSNKYIHTDYSIWNQRLKNGQIILNNIIEKKNSILKNGDLLQYKRSPWIEPDIPHDFNILYEDKDIVAINKPQGLPVLPSSIYLLNTLLNIGKKRFGKEFSPLHRLDKGTTGIVLCGKTVKGRKYLGKEMQEKRVIKRYLTVTKGLIKEKNFIIDKDIGFIDYPKLGKVTCVSEQGKKAVTKILEVKTNVEKNISIVKIQLNTGRTHQIRIHLASIGHPLVGEEFYGMGGIPKVSADKCNLKNDVKPGDEGFLLHSFQVEFCNLKGNLIKIEAIVPQTFNNYKESL